LKGARTALVVLNGEPPSAALLRHLALQADIVVAADGGSNILKNYGIRADVIVGDLDSIRPATRRHFATTRIIELPEQDSTDFEKTFGFLIRERISDAMVVGMGGNRIDFTLGNFVALWPFVPRLDLSILGDGWFALPVRGPLELSLPVGTTVSLIPFSRCTGVTVEGFRYPLREARMSYGALGVSNVTTRKSCSVTLKSGKLLLIALTK
jgi:thiamine pyrophosphokinase